MDKIAVLGPKGTFTERATLKYMEALKLEGELMYYPSMRKAFAAIGDTCRIGVIPIENTLDGFVQIILDLLTNTDLKVIHEIVLPIRFAFVANCEEVDQVEQVFVQFKSENQCSDFLEGFREKQIITTASNSQSYEQLKEALVPSGAIIPMHMLETHDDFKFIKRDVADSLYNETRFIVLSKQLNEEIEIHHKWKTFFVVSGDSDRPGLLVDILNTISKDGINLKSIISRPTRTGLGNYNFFIDIDGCYQKDQKVRETIQHVLDQYNIKILGSYYRVEAK